MKVRLRNCNEEANAWAVNEPLVKTLGIRTKIHGGYPTMNAGTRQVLEILLLSSHGKKNEDLTAVRKVRTTARQVQVLLIGEEQSFYSAGGREFTDTFRETLQRRTLRKACERCKVAKQSVPARFAPRCSGTWNEKRLLFLRPAYTSGWD
jgi:hypothetical protein